MSGPSILLPFQPATMSGAQLAAVSFLARYSGRTRSLYAYQLREWFAWCESNGVDPLVGVQRAHVELYIRGLGNRGLMDSSVNTMMHAVRGYFRLAHIDGLIGSDPAVYARLPKVHRDESRTQGLDRLELIRPAPQPVAGAAAKGSASAQDGVGARLRSHVGVTSAPHGARAVVPG
jgi:site-specific recombinase XerD